MSEPLDDLRQRWAEEAAQRGELDAARELEAVASDEQSGEGVSALEQLRRERDDDQIPWRRSA